MLPISEPLSPLFQLVYLCLVCVYVEMVAFSYSLQDSLSTVGDDLKQILQSGKASRQLLLELALHAVGYGSQYLPRRVYNIHSIYDAIKALEAGNLDGQGMKSASVFRHPPLKGLYHKHHYQACYIPKNLGLEWNTGKTLDNLIRESITETGAKPGDDVSKILGVLSHKVTFTALEKRRERQALTGEYLVYASVDGCNYYLTLAAHSEDDWSVYERVKQCFEEFPELQTIVTS